MNYDRSLICKHCGQQCYALLKKIISSNGVVMVAYYHADAKYEHRATDWLSKEFISKVGIDVSNVPLKYQSESNQCEVCGDNYAECHHWLPRHIDPENSWKWPTGYLCRKCHMEWHKKVTPAMCEV